MIMIGCVIFLKIFPKGANYARDLCIYNILQSSSGDDCLYVCVYCGLSPIGLSRTLHGASDAHRQALLLASSQASHVLLSHRYEDPGFQSI